MIYTCLSNQNKCLSFKGSNKKDYQNELCFDKNTIASKEIKNAKFNKEEQELIDLWNKILSEAKKTKKYNKNLNYGVYQITKDLNTYKEIKSGSKVERKYDYPDLNGYLNAMVVRLKNFYRTNIKEKMFDYELLK